MTSPALPVLMIFWRLGCEAARGHVSINRTLPCLGWRPSTVLRPAQTIVMAYYTPYLLLLATCLAGPCQEAPDSALQLLLPRYQVGSM